MHQCNANHFWKLLFLSNSSRGTSWRRVRGWRGSKSTGETQIPRTSLRFTTRKTSPTRSEFQRRTRATSSITRTRDSWLKVRTRRTTRTKSNPRRRKTSSRWLSGERSIERDETKSVFWQKRDCDFCWQGLLLHDFLFPVCLSLGLHATPCTFYLDGWLCDVNQ